MQLGCLNSSTIWDNKIQQFSFQEILPVRKSAYSPKLQTEDELYSLWGVSTNPGLWLSVTDYLTHKNLPQAWIIHNSHSSNLQNILVLINTISKMHLVYYRVGLRTWENLM